LAKAVSFLPSSSLKNEGRREASDLMGPEGEELAEAGVCSKKKERAMEAAARQYRGTCFIVRRGVAK
jgi:hypothetical protein